METVIEMPTRGALRKGPVAEGMARIKSNDIVTGDYRLMVLDAPPEMLDCRAGQFFHILCPTGESFRPYLRRPMSIYGFDPAAGELKFLYKVTGEGTGALSELRDGAEVNLLGPLGNGFTIREDWKNLLLVARGVGLATLAPLAKEAREAGCTLTAICSARTEALLMSIAEFEAMGAEVIPVTDDAGTSGVEALREVIEGRIAEGGLDAMYTCGSNRILTLLQDIGARHAIPGEIALEQQMACGLGMCHCCVRSFRREGGIVHERVCREGPVFDLQEAMGW
ncbi:dihydroorotate dehydrogenase electron transfer subunit [Tranquillimonas rosea]|uniref:dihydroorotate dehydrogenase electron transfer subunit n=1 Tax=Tranquillimonas rosea TaxID=641238 RepID=UPI003BABD855